MMLCCYIRNEKLICLVIVLATLSIMICEKVMKMCVLNEERIYSVAQKVGIEKYLFVEDFTLVEVNQRWRVFCSCHGDLHRSTYVYGGEDYS